MSWRDKSRVCCARVCSSNLTLFSRLYFSAMAIARPSVNGARRDSWSSKVVSRSLSAIILACASVRGTGSTAHPASSMSRHNEDISPVRPGFKT